MDEAKSSDEIIETDDSREATVKIETHRKNESFDAFQAACRQKNGKLANKSSNFKWKKTHRRRLLGPQTPKRNCKKYSLRVNHYQANVAAW